MTESAAPAPTEEDPLATAAAEEVAAEEAQAAALAAVPEPPPLIARQVTLDTVFRMKAVRELFVRAFTPEDEQRLPNAIDAIDWCMQRCDDPQVGIFLAVEGEEPPDFVFRGLVIAEDPGEGALWSLGPQVLHFHSTGSDVVDVLAGAVADWMRSRGLESLYVLNFMGVSDKAHARLFSSRFESAKLASMLEMKVKP